MQNGIDSSFIDSLKNKADIVQVISRYCPLTQKGKSFECCCPFHHEKTPSFKVNQESQFYHCFGCGESGDVINFVRKQENCDFVKAVEIIANMYSIEIPQKAYSETILKDKQQKDTFLNINKDAAKFYNKELYTENGKPCLDYLLKRGLSIKTINRFGLGASNSWEGVTRHLLGKGYNKADLVAAGIADEKNERIFDSFFGRVIFPLINTFGNVVGFSARVLDPEAKTVKYKNTKDTIIFNKSKVLFNINNIKKQKQDQKLTSVILVEGQMDVIKLYEKNVINAIATLGTALTDYHAREIKRFTDNVFVCFDGDNAGQNATLRSLNILKEADLNVKVVMLDKGMDPDEYVSSFGKDAFLALVESGKSIMEYHLNRLAKKYNLTDKEQNIKFVNEALVELKQNSNDIEFDVYLHTISELSKVSISILKDKVNSSLREKVQKEEYKDFKPKNAGVEATKFILASLLYQKEFAKIIDSEDFYFMDSDLNKLYNLIVKQNIKISSLFDEFDVDNSPIIKDIINFDFNSFDNPNQFYNDCVKNLILTNLNFKLEDLNKCVLGADNDEDRMNYLVKVQQLVLKINKLKAEDN